MLSNKVYDLADLPKDNQPVKSKLVFKVKHDSDGKIVKHKT